MALKLSAWLELQESQENDPKHQTIACIEGHKTSLAEMEQLGTHGFCPRCSEPITDEASEAYHRMLEEYAEQTMIARDYFIKTGEIPEKTRIPIDKTSLQVTTVIGMPYTSFPQK